MKKNQISKSSALSAFTAQVARLVDLAGFCDQTLAMNPDELPYFDESDQTLLTGICQDIYKAINNFTYFMSQIARYEDNNTSRVED